MRKPDRQVGIDFAHGPFLRIFWWRGLPSFAGTRSPLESHRPPCGQWFL